MLTNANSAEMLVVTKSLLDALCRDRSSQNVLPSFLLV